MSEKEMTYGETMRSNPPMPAKASHHGDVFSVEIRCNYYQESDTCSDMVDDNELEIFTQDGGLGPYFVIKTGRWAFDTIDELIETLRDFERRAKIGVK
jgi:hypothetical protein